MTPLKFTITGHYEADPEQYGESDEPLTPERMAWIDQDEFESGGIGVYDILEWAGEKGVTVVIEAE
jgi:hypothetical protein